MSTVVVPRRHALGLPPGSVRAVHVLMIVGLVCAILLHPNHMPIPPYLLYLLFMVLGHFFAAHGVTIAASHASPLYLPAGLIRVLVIVALGGSIGWKLYSEEAALYQQFEQSIDLLKAQPFLPLVLLGAFFLGVSVRAIVGREAPPVALQDIEAWLSIMASVGLGIAVIYHLIIAPTLEHPTSLPEAEAVLAAVIAFYFGERS